MIECPLYNTEQVQLRFDVLLRAILRQHKYQSDADEGSVVYDIISRDIIGIILSLQMKASLLHKHLQHTKM